MPLGLKTPLKNYKMVHGKTILIGFWFFHCWHFGVKFNNKSLFSCICLYYRCRIQNILKIRIGRVWCCTGGSQCSLSHNCNLKYNPESHLRFWKLTFIYIPYSLDCRIEKWLQVNFQYYRIEILDLSMIQSSSRLLGS